MKLELKHLAPYLPYKINYIDDKGVKTSMNTIDFGCNLVNMGWGNALEPKEIKPILRPLSDLTKGEYAFIWENEITVNEISGFIKSDNHRLEMWKLPYTFWVELFKDHFDVFGLIEKGLAIDINTLEK